MLREVIKFYQPYINRNADFETFAYDVNTLGGTFFFNEECTLKESGWIETTKDKVIIKNKKWKVLSTIPLKEIWRVAKGNQGTLI